MIKPEYEKYATKMNDMGDCILAILNKYFNNKLDTNEELKNKKTRCSEGRTELKSVKMKFMLAVVPDIIKKEHNELIETIQKFITGADYMFNAVDESNPSLIVNNKIMGLEGRKLQLEAEKEINVTVEKICKKFGI